MVSVTCARSSWPARSVFSHCSWRTASKRSGRSTRPRWSRSPASSPPSNCPARPIRSSLLRRAMAAYPGPEMGGRAHGPRASNLPADLTSFVGRRQELREVKRLLTTTRLLTLTGSGGAGKTRLALRAASEMSRGFPDGAWLVQLASIHDPLLVTQAVFSALGVHDLSGGLSLSSLTEYVAGKRLLLVLDNCEHLLDACAVLAVTLVKACPELQLLATSRQALGVTGEVRMVVPPMSLPAEEDEVPAQRLLSWDAVWLLTERAAAVVPGFTVDAENA